MPAFWGEITRDGAIRPYARWQSVLEDIKPGVRLRVTVDTDRNGKFNSLFHLCLRLIAKAVNRGPAATDIDQLKEWIKLKKGWFDVVDLPNPVDGVAHVIRFKSTSFAAMGEKEFHAFAVDACELIRAELAPWIVNSPEWRDVRAIIDQIHPEGILP